MNFLNEYLKCIFNIDDKSSATILIPVIITIAVFISGILFNLFIAWIREFIKRNRTKKAVKIILEDITLDCKKQYEALIKYSDSLDIDHDDNFNLNTESFGHLRTIDKLNFSDLYNIWFRFWYYLNSDERIKSFNKCFKILEKIRFYEKQIGDYLNTFSSSFNSNLNAFNTSVHKLRDTCATLSFENSGIKDNPSLEEYLMELDKIVSEYLKNPDSGKITIQRKKLLLPIKELNEKSNQRISIILNNNVLDALHAFKNINHSIKTFKSLFSDLSNNFKEFSEKLDKIIQDYF